VYFNEGLALNKKAASTSGLSRVTTMISAPAAAISGLCR
jgi:hypothetical protein